MDLKNLKLDFDMEVLPENNSEINEEIKAFEDKTGHDETNVVNENTNEDMLFSDAFDSGFDDTIDEVDQITFEAIDVNKSGKTTTKEKKEKKEKKADSKNTKTAKKTIDEQVRELDKVQIKVFGNEIMLLDKSNGSLNNTFSTKDIQSKLIRDFGYDEFINCDFHLIIKENNNKEGVLIPTPKFFKKG